MKIGLRRKSKNSLHDALLSDKVYLCIIIGVIANAILTAVELAAPGLIGKQGLVDYHAFFVAGQMFWEGRLEEAYFAKTLFPAQAEITGSISFMPWTYPPHFNLLTAVLAIAPIWLGYTIFISLTFLFYALMLRYITPEFFKIVLLFTFPSVLICIHTGQNGFLIAGVIAYFLLNFEQNKAKSIISIALLSVKPHFVATLYILAAIRKQNIVVIGGLGATAIFVLITIPLFGFGVWPAFHNALQEASFFLREGFYPFFRMTSLYAALFTIGAPPDIAFGLQVVVALIALGTILFANTRKWPRNHLYAITLMVSIFMTPYAYDYDLQIFGVALAFLIKDLLMTASAKQITILLFGCWLSSASFIFEFTDDELQVDGFTNALSLNFWFLAFTCIYSLYIVRNATAIRWFDFHRNNCAQ